MTRNETVTPKPAGTARQQAWLRASVDQRVKFAEQLGDEGARSFAKAKGWPPLFDGKARGIIQGPDQVYQAADGAVHVIEAKGGSGQLGHAYGHPQGSSEWAVESAKKVLRHKNASEAERRAAKLIIEAAAKGKLQVHVVRTTHVLGEPMAVVLEQTVACSDDATRLAKPALDDLARAAANGLDDVARATDDVARVAAEGSTAAKTIAKAAVPVAVVIDAGFRIRDGIETEQRFAAGEITVQQREVAHANNAAGMAGGWAGAWAGAEIGAWGGGIAGTAVVPGAGTTVGGIAGGLAGGIAGYFGGEAAAQTAAEWTVEQIHAAGTTIGEAAESAWEFATDTAGSVADDVSRAWNWAWGN